MSDRRFLDTNILVYAFATDEEKGPVAEALLVRGNLVSIQVLNEFANVSRRKLGLSWDLIDERIELLQALLDEPQQITLEIHTSARAIARTRKISFYDALIVAAAIAAGCSELLTEDLQHGAKFENLRVRNPFLEA